MIVEITKPFEKQCRDLPLEIRNRLKKMIEAILETENLSSISSIKQLKTDKKEEKACFRIKIGDYRFGFILVNKNMVRLVVAGHRGEIYRKFP